jgi:hypothetical protein
VSRAATSVARFVALLLAMLLPCLVPLPFVPGWFLPQFSAAAATPAAIVDTASFEAWLSATGRPITSRYHAYRASYDTFRRYGLLVYGTPGLVPGNRYSAATREYAMLGFSYDEFTFTNSFFPDDKPAGTTSSTPWAWTGSWQEIPLGTDATVSWLRLTAREKEHVKASVLYYSGSSYGGMTFPALGLSEVNTIVLSPPSWLLGFAMHTKHYWKTATNLRYATFTGKGIGSVGLDCTLTETARPADGIYRIPSAADSVRIPVRATASISAYAGLARAGDVARLGAAVGGTSVEGNGATSRAADGWIEVRRTSLGGAASATVTATGTAWAVSVLGDPVFDTASLALTVEDEGKTVSPFLSVGIVGDIGYFRGQTDLLGRRVALDPKRFLALETVTVTAVFSACPESVLFRPCGTLLAATYRDSRGNLYLQDDFVRKVSKYPAEFTVVPTPGTTRVSFRFQLPLAPATVSWDDRVLSKPYDFRIQATVAGRVWTADLTGIAMTGDVYDILYLQPS